MILEPHYTLLDDNVSALRQQNPLRDSYISNTAH